MIEETPFVRYVVESLGDALRILEIGDAPLTDHWHSLRGLTDVEVIRSPVTVLEESDPTGQMSSQQFWHRNPWGRLSAARTSEIRSKLSAAGVPAPEAPRDVTSIPDGLLRRGLTDVDFIRLSLGGPDFVVLRALREFLGTANVLGLTMVANYFGSSDDDAHTFHNVDRLMKSAGFEIFALDVRHYAMAALPAPYTTASPGSALWGRPLQGEVVYLRDAASADNITWSLAAGEAKLAKLAALFSALGLPDCAGDLLTTTRCALDSIIDVANGLNYLTAQSAGNNSCVSDYAQYVALFEADDPMFYRVDPQAPIGKTDPSARNQGFFTHFWGFLRNMISRRK